MMVLKKVCAGLDQSTASRAPAGRWSPKEILSHLWGPKGLTAPFCKIDFRVGGVFHNCMRSPKGKDYWSTGVYREIVPLERIVCTDSFADEKGNVVPATSECLTLTYIPQGMPTNGRT